MRSEQQFGDCFFPSLIDYAGLFPPAALPLQTAFEKYLQYRAGHFSWALGRFICTLSHYQELVARYQELVVSPRDGALSSSHQSCSKLPDFPLPVSLVAKEIGPNFVQDHPAVLEHRQTFPIESIETVVPQGLRDVGALCELLHVHTGVLRSMGEDISIFYELSPQLDGKPTWELDVWKRGASCLIAALRSCNNGSKRGLKIRCGGVEDSMIPPVEILSHLLIAVAESQIPVKFTAGLHAPFRHAPGPSDGSLTSDMHGFFNVFFAAFVAYSQKVSSSDVCQILLNREPPVVAEGGVRCLDWELPLSTISRLRTEKVVSFGSCSFLEPIEYGEELGWL